jgi:hypothetical protein
MSNVSPPPPPKTANPSSTTTLYFQIGDTAKSEPLAKWNNEARAHHFTKWLRTKLPLQSNPPRLLAGKF